MLPTTPGAGRLGDLGDLGSLEVVDLVADLRERSRDQSQQRRELRHAVARREPARVRHGEPQPRHHAALQLRPLRPPRRERPDRAGELPDREPRLRLLDPLQMARDLRRPHRGLESERDRQARLPVGAPQHHRAAVAPGEAEQAPLDVREVAPHDRQHALHHERGPRVGDVLHRRAVVDPGAPIGAEPALQHPDQPERRVPAATRLLRHRLEVEQLDPGVLGDVARGVLRDQPELRLRARQRGDDGEPRPGAPPVVEQLARLLRRPEVVVHGHGAASVSSCSACRTSSSVAPHGTIICDPERSMPRSARGST